MNRLSIAALVVMAVALLAAGAFAEELALPKDRVEEYPQSWNWFVQDIDAYGGTERHGIDYTGEGEPHGDNGPGDAQGNVSGDDIETTIPIGLVGVRNGGR